MDKLIRRGYENLANAIVIRAVADYTRAAAALAIDPDDYIAKSEIRSIEDFFRGSLYSSICKYDGELMIEKLRKGEARFEDSRGRIGAYMLDDN